MGYLLTMMTRTEKTLTALNAALYAAARKAGMDRDLYAAHAEIVGRGTDSDPFVVVWDPEVEADCAPFVNRAAIARAESWLARRLAKRAA